MKNQDAKDSFFNLLEDVVGICKPDGQSPDFIVDNHGQNKSKSIKKIMIKKGIFDTSLNLKFNKSEAKILLINALKSNRHFSDFGAFNCLNNANVDIKEICNYLFDSLYHS